MFSTSCAPSGTLLSEALVLVVLSAEELTLSDWEAPPIRSWLALLAAKAPPNPAPPQSTAIAATMATIFPVRWVLGFFGGCCSVKFISGCVF